VKKRVSGLVYRFRLQSLQTSLLATLALNKMKSEHKEGMVEKEKRKRRAKRRPEEENGNSTMMQAKENDAGKRVGSKPSRNRNHKQSSPSEKCDSPHSFKATMQDSTITPASKRLSSASGTSGKLIDEASEQYRSEQFVHDEFHYITINQSLVKHEERVHKLIQEHIDDLAGRNRKFEKDLQVMNEEHEAEVAAFKSISRDFIQKNTEKSKIPADKDFSTLSE